MKPHPDLVEFCLTHDPRQAQQQTVVVGAWVIEAFAISNEHAEYRAKFEELMPVPIVASQTRSIEADHQTRIAKADFGDQLLETVTIHAAGA